MDFIFYRARSDIALKRGVKQINTINWDCQKWGKNCTQPKYSIIEDDTIYEAIMQILDRLKNKWKNWKFYDDSI